MRRPALLLPAGLVAASCLLAACGGSSSSPSAASSTTPASSAAPSASADPALAAQVPAALKSKGTIVVGTDSTYAPSEFLAADGKTVQGFDVDLFTAVAAKLGLKAQFQSSPFDSIIPGVDSGKYDVGVSSFTINPDRQKKVEMVSYFSAGTLWAARKGNPAGVDPAKPCGKRIAVQKGTVQVDDLAKRAKACGAKAPTVDQYQGQDQATAAVVSGKDDAMLADSPVTAYAVKQANGALDALGSTYDSAPYGYVLPKAEAGTLGQAIAAAVKALIADGTYQRVLATWGVQQGGLAADAVKA